MTEHEMAQLIFQRITKNYFLSPHSRLFARVAAEDAAREIMTIQEGERQHEATRPLRTRTVVVRREA